MIKQSTRLAICSLAWVVVSGCDRIAETSYVYTRQTPALGRNSPTVFVARVAVNVADKTVVWSEDVSDAQGDLDHRLTTLKDCTILNSENWECPPVIAPGEGVVDQLSMREGVLFQKYWHEDRKFESRRKYFGRN